jgi:small conductance mechanosensitive channel
MVESLPELQEEQAELSERLEVILNALEHKGGDPTAYRQYITAIRGIDLAVTDARTGWAMLTGWLTSEQGGKRWMWNIIKFLVILMAFYFGASIIAGFVRRAGSRVKNASQLLIAFLGKFVKQVTMVIGVIVALAALEVNIAPLLAAVGAAGFVVGFALQDTLSNFASGLLILAYNPFDEDDVIEAAGVSGMVSSVSLFSTHIRTFDNKVMIVPNNDIWGGTITNATASKTRRVDMVFGIGYEDDVDQAKKILETLVQEHELVLPAPAPVVQMNELGDSSINFICRPWTKTSDFWTVYWDITRAVKIEFDRNGISIPFPQQDIHVYQETKQTDA